MPPAGGEHGNIASNLGARMHIFADDNDLGAIFAAETGFLLERKPDTVRAPDIAFVCKDRLPEGKIPRSYFPAVPDPAVEAVLPGDKADEIDHKENAVTLWHTFGLVFPSPKRKA